MRMPSDDVDTLVRYFCLAPATALIGPFSPIGGAHASLVREELIVDRYYRYRLVDGSRQPVDLHVYLDLSELGGVLWERQVRTLLKVTGAGSPALTATIAGRYVDAETTAQAGVSRDVAFVATQGADYTLAHQGARAYFAGRPLEAARQFTLLAHGLAALHDVRIAHRNLWPDTIDVSGAEPPQLRIARFEMSAQVSDLTRRQVPAAVVDREAVRRLYLSQGSLALAYSPPERLAFLLPEQSAGPHFETATSDVYGLGAIVWDWFFGPFPEDFLPDPPPIEVGSAAVRLARDGLAKLHEHRLAAIRTNRTVPAVLREVMSAMLSMEQRDRPTAAEVADRLIENRSTVAIAWEPPPVSAPHLVLYMPEESRLTLYRWQMVEQDPATEQGGAELRELIVNDLRRGFLFHSPHGAVPFIAAGGEDARRSANCVLLGREIVWFCHPYRPRSPFGGLEEPRPEALLIAFVAKRSDPPIRRVLDELLQSVTLRELPEVQALPSTMSRKDFAALVAQLPSWQPLIESVRPLMTVPPQQLSQLQAIDWLIEYHGVELRSRQYPYKCDNTASGAEFLLSWDRERDLRRIHGSAMFTRYAATRAEMGDFFEQLGRDDEGDLLELLGDLDGRPAPRVFHRDADLVRVEGADRIVVRIKGGRVRIPAEGWISPQDDFGTAVAQRRQLQARSDLLKLPGLMAQLRNPSAIELQPHYWKNAGEGLKGNAPDIVEKILSCHPISAVQGPPGTGKTTVVARAVRAYLERQESDRVLVSAQSNFALDNLAIRILKEIGAMDGDERPHDEDAPVAIRLTSRRAELDPRVEPWRWENLVVRRAGQVRAHLAKQLAKTPAELGSGVRAVLERWDERLSQTGESAQPELADRLQRAARVLFVTCNTATRDMIAPDGSTAMFDWVIVEEAAKAWPTELFLPLVRGLRWTLVGDYRQLPAHRRDEVIRFLDSSLRDPYASVLAGSRDEMLANIDLFRHLFEGNGTRPQGAIRPTFELSTQFRMREPIAQIASRVFYPAADGRRMPDGLPPGGLATDRDTEPGPAPITSPQWLRGQALIWLDTHNLPGCREEPRWSNQGEAAVVQRLVARLRPVPRPREHGYGDTPLAILTPYRAQRDLLMRHTDLIPLLYTTHAYQGREADVVIISLVRDNSLGGSRPDIPWQAYGHLVSRELVNVMTSRARRLMVLVGDFHHFAAYMDNETDFWQDVCQVVKSHGQVLSAEVVGDGQDAE